MEKGSPSKEGRNRAQFFQEEGKKRKGEKKRKENRDQSSKAAPVLPLTEWVLIFFRLVKGRQKKKKKLQGSQRRSEGGSFCPARSSRALFCLCLLFNRCLS